MCFLRYFGIFVAFAAGLGAYLLCGWCLIPSHIDSQKHVLSTCCQRA